MRTAVKVLIAGIGVAYSAVATKIAVDEYVTIGELKFKLKQSKKKAKKYRKELDKPPYKRSVLPRNSKTIPKTKPKYPIGFS